METAEPSTEDTVNTRPAEQGSSVLFSPEFQTVVEGFSDKEFSQASFADSWVEWPWLLAASRSSMGFHMESLKAATAFS